MPLRQQPNMLAGTQLIAAHQLARQSKSEEQYAHVRPDSARRWRRCRLNSATVKILVVATKSPWPPRDGGRLALWLTLQGLAQAGHEIRLIAPIDADAQARIAEPVDELHRVCTPQWVPVAQRSWFNAAVHALRSGSALTIARHRHTAVDRAVKHCIASWRPQVVHVEQLQALANCDGARAAGIPIVLRMQNVESALWRQVAQARLRSWPLLTEARRLRNDEQRAITKVTRVVALTERDADALRTIGGTHQRTAITAIAPPFPNQLPAAAAISGAPAVVIAGSAGWWPNTEGTHWFVHHVVPALHAIDAQARIHVYGGEAITDANITQHPAPDDAIDAFPEGAIAAVPLHIGSGIRMRILEAWARGLAVVATTVAARGLQITSGQELLIADSAEDFAAAIMRVHKDPKLRQQLIDNGRRYLAVHHDSALLREALITEYESACASQSTRS